MSEKIAVRINSGLKAVFNPDDPIYRAVICDKEGSLDPALDAPERTIKDKTALYYSFDDDTCDDSSGNNRDGTVTNVTYTDGKYGRALSLTNESTFSVPEFTLGEDFEINFLAKRI